MARKHWRFPRMQRGQQRDQKQVAVVKTERPTLAWLLLQVVKQVSDIIAQMRQRSAVRFLPRNQRLRRTRGAEPLGQREGLHHGLSRLITRWRTSHSPAINMPISR